MKVAQERVDALLKFAYEQIPDLQIYYKDEHIPVFWIRFIFFFAKVIGFFSKAFKKRWKTRISNGLGGKYIIFPSRSTHSDLRDYRVYKIFRHELVHLIDQKRHPFLFNATYTIFPLPTILSGRAHWEFRGYAQNMIVQYDEFGKISDRTLEFIAKNFTGYLYFWMFPFKKRVMKKLVKLREQIVSGEVTGMYPDLKFYFR